MRSRNACRAHASTCRRSPDSTTPARRCSPPISRGRAASEWSSRSSAPRSSSPRSRRRSRSGKEGGEGAWMLSLELLQWQHEQAKFDERAVDFAVAFELSPPSWEPPPRAGRQGDAAGDRRHSDASKRRGARRTDKDNARLGRRAGRSRRPSSSRSLADVAQAASGCADRHDRRRAHRFHLRRRAAQRDQPDREPGQGGADHRRHADRPRAAAADRHFAAALRQEGRTDALQARASDRDVSRDDDPVGSPRRRRRAGRRRPGDARPRRHQGDARARCGASITTRCSPDSRARRPTRSRCSSASRRSSRSIRDI